MNENRMIAVLALVLLTPGLIWALGDFRAGKVRMMLFSRRRSTVETYRDTDPRRFWAYTAFNLAVCAVVGVFAMLLFFKPE
ncbi:hypothetical protein [Novosphingobium sp. Leaf2]|uniref:hypothetical protein n=1 Tax=Novosphingobium sp. Leaf2 TaxID=1735670 RepID=UPI0006F948CA|nr:hypothetical protein [Novosphingobium sp. Leaf2]KQM21569.1 hypothetical protein ASE49_14285 [Novosphingobium sp. Leaf2]